MSPPIRMIAMLLVLAVLPSRVFGLATEHHGNDPIGPGTFPVEVLAVANLPSRVYWREVNGDPQFFFKGNIEALNRALETFAKIKGEKEILLLPGPSDVHTLGERRRVACNWDLHAPDGLYVTSARQEKGTQVLTKHPRLTIYISVAGPSAPADIKQVEQCIADLDSDKFDVREKATHELEKLGRTAGSALRKTKESSRNPEQLRRIDRLLEKLDGIDLELVRIPDGVKVLSPKDLRDRYMEGLKSADWHIRGAAVGGLGEAGRYTDDVVPTLLGVLKNDSHEYVRRCVASALARLGKRAAPSLATLKEGLHDPDVNVRNAFEIAIDWIENPKEEQPTSEQLKQRQELADQIDKHCKQPVKKEKKRGTNLGI